MSEVLLPLLYVYGPTFIIAGGFALIHDLRNNGGLSPRVRQFIVWAYGIMTAVIVYYLYLAITG